MITSKANPKVKEIRLLHQAKHRRVRREFFLEGVRLVEETLEQTERVRKMVYSPRLEETDRGAELLSAARRKISKAEWLYVSDEVMGAICDTRSHQGILAVLEELEEKEQNWGDLLERKRMIFLLHSLQDPGNLGTIFLVAEAGGIGGLILSAGSADPYSPKAARASMGSLLRVPFLINQDIADCVTRVKSKGYSVWATATRQAPAYWEVDFTSPAAVLFGQEGAGIPEHLMKIADGQFTIPMFPGVESLNVAMAAGLVAYEAFRQKQIGGKRAKNP